MLHVLKDISIDSLKGIGPARSRLFTKLGVRTVADLLLFAPRRYQNWANIKRISELEDGTECCVRGNVVLVTERRTRRKNLVITTATIDDGTGQLEVLWFGQYRRGGSFIGKRLSNKLTVTVLGQVSWEYGKWVMKNPELRVSGENGSPLEPIYPLTAGLSQTVVRSIIERAYSQYIDQVQDTLPSDVLYRQRLPALPEAIRMLHFPQSMDEVNAAWRRLAFSELFELQMILLRRRLYLQENQVGICHVPDGELVQAFLAALPFELTRAQVRAMKSIQQDMERSVPMRRLVQGDVGSGKTIIAIYAMLKAVAGGYQAAFMVPTEVLAEQHFASLVRYLGPLGINIRMLTGRLTRKEREQVLDELARGEIKVIVGTHALIQPDVNFHKLGLIVIDEQHRFGVEQRQALSRPEVDVLVMTATPIPRTLALTIYGDMDLTIVDELPPGRKPVDTRWIAEKDRPQLYQFIRKELKQGRQAYIVYPLIEESEEITARAAVSEAERLAREVFPDFTVGLLHGQMSYQDKDAVMQKFYEGLVDVLVTTTVIEVGVDVPNASIMMIENAERFGLAQLHQLRGRVGRGPYQSYCFLLGTPSTKEGIARLDIMRKVNDGFRIAEADLAIRGPGELLGLRQSGYPELKFAQLDDLALLEAARQEAKNFLAKEKENAGRGPSFSGRGETGGRAY